MHASVIIPTYNRSEALDRALTSLTAQQKLDRRATEVIVADDGSVDDTKTVLRRYADASVGSFRYTVLSKNGGPARARNEAIKLATGRILIITGDDIISPPGYLSAHLDWHERHPAEEAAVLGRVSWPEAIHPTPFMKWLEGPGRSFYMNFADLATDRPIDPASFYTCNVSVKRSLCLRAGAFDESFPYASHEDLEWGVRLGTSGMQLYYDPTILAEHWHVLDVKRMARRVYLMGYSAKTYWERVPDRAPMMRRKVREALAIWNRVRGSGAMLELLIKRPEKARGKRAFYWKLVMTLSYCAGLADARAGRPPRALPA